MTDVGYSTKPMSLKAYKKNKIKMLEREFMIPLTQAQKDHINSLENEYAVDRHSRSLMKKRLFGNEI